MALAAIVLLAASAAAQPFQPGTGFAPLGMQLLHLMRHRHGSTQCNIDMASQCNVLYLAIWHSCVCVNVTCMLGNTTLIAKRMRACASPHQNFLKAGIGCHSMMSSDGCVQAT